MPWCVLVSIVMRRAQGVFQTAHLLGASLRVLSPLWVWAGIWVWGSVRASAVGFTPFSERPSGGPAARLES